MQKIIKASIIIGIEDYKGNGEGEKMNRKKILQIVLAASTIAGGITLSQEVVMAATVSQNSFIQGTLTAPNLQKGQVVNITTNLRVRSGANTNSSVVGYLNNGADVNIIGQDGEWYKISFNGKDAFVNKSYVKVSGTVVSTTNTVTTTTVKKGQVINVTTSLNIRQGASSSTAILGSLKNGNTFDILSKSGNWYNIKTGSIVGFISGDYVKEISSEPVAETPKDTQVNTGTTSNGTIVNVSTNLRVRSAASTSGTVLGYLLNGAKITITGEEDTWYQIKYNNTSAYISKDYVQKNGVVSTPSEPEVTTPSKPEVITPPKDTTTSSTSETGKVVNVNTSLRVRDSASVSGNVVGSLTNGATVNITGESGDWYIIKYNNSKAYVSKEYVQKNVATSETTPESATKPNPSGGTTTGGSTKENEKQKGKVINVSTNLRIRAEANTTSTVLGYLINGQAVTVNGKSGDWYKISYSGIEGYVSNSYIQIIDGSTDETTKNKQTGSVYENVLNTMKAHIGSPYVWGGSGEYLTTSLLDVLKNRYPYQKANGAYIRATSYADKGYRAFDCSGLMQWGFRQAGVSIGRSTWDQIGNGVEVSLDKLQPGDLLFYSSLEHVGMYVGNGQWIEAPNKNANVRITNVPWGSIGRARRVIKN